MADRHPLRRAFDIFYDPELSTEEIRRQLEGLVAFWEGHPDDDPQSGEAVQARGYLASIGNAARWAAIERENSLGSPAIPASANLEFPQALYCVSGELGELCRNGPVRRAAGLPDSGRL
jgi:hypothetical protein